jgi:hypothetical protein
MQASTTIPKGLRAERLMERMRDICKGLPRRQPTHEGEKKAADYVLAELSKLGIKDAKLEKFKGIATLGLPATLTASLCLGSLLLGAFCGLIGKLAAGPLLCFAAFTFFQLLSCRPPLFRKLIERRDSQNVIATVSASKEAKRRIFLIGHLDANKQRFIFPPPIPALMKPMETSVVLLAALDGLSFLISAAFGLEGFFYWFWIASIAVFAVFLLLLAADEFQPTIEGANDNATAVSTLLGIAESLGERPLEKTEVTLLFTGCEEVGNHGIIAYADTHHPPIEGSYWIDIEMVGTGDIAYATKHGISYLTEYRPGAEILGYAERTAKENPEFAVTGRDMLMLEEVSPLRIRGHNAICVLGCDKKGNLPHWHRVSDNLDNIEPETLSRAARYVWALMKSIDSGV